MSARTFFTADARAQVASAIAAVERQTSAEVVVAVRERSGHYRHTDYLVGFAASLGALCVFLFHPAPFRSDLFPLESVAFFALGSLACAHLPPLRRRLTAPSLLTHNVALAARAAFVELGVARTHRRQGILVFVSMFERRVAVVADAGVDEAALGASWKAALEALEAAVAHQTHVDRFVAALTGLGPILQAALPHHDGDENELPDEVQG